VTEAINHNFELLDKLINDDQSNNSVLTSNNYWMNYTKRIERHIRNADLNHMRTNYNLTKGFAWGGVPKPTVSNLYIKRITFYFLEKLFPFTKVANEYKRLLNATHRRNIGLLKNVAHLCLEEIHQNFQDIILTNDTCNGDAEDVFEYNDYNISAEWVTHLARAADLYSQNQNLLKAKSLLEIGPGIGLNTLAHFALNKNLNIVMNVDIPHILYLSTQFLKSVKFIKVIDYLDFEKIDLRDIGKDEKIVVQLPPWALDKVDINFDLLLNHFSFQEMEKNIVSEYLALLRKKINFAAFIQNRSTGHKKGAGGQMEPVTLDFIASCFDKDEFIEKDLNPKYASKYWDLQKDCSKVFLKKKN
jgi:putative sugar O-methyltransferase|tara:strand:- start:3124 stop:4200 length:1077 start_codon:yes stop_codon:yes gene_type:complete